MRAKSFFLFILYSLLYICSGTLWAAFFEISKRTVDGIIVSINTNNYNHLIFYFGLQLWTLLIYCVDRMCIWWAQIVGRRVELIKREELLQIVFKDKNHVSWEWFEKNFGNDKLFVIVNNDVEQAINSYKKSVLRLIHLFSALLPLFVFFFLTHFLVGTYIFIFALVINLSSLVGGKKLSAQAMLFKEKNKIFTEKVNNYLENLQILSLKKLQVDVYKKFIDPSSQEREKINWNNTNTQAKISFLSNSLVDWFVILTTLTISYLIIFWDTLTVGSILAILGALSMFTPHMKGIIDGLREIKVTRDLFSKISPLAIWFSDQLYDKLLGGFQSLKVVNLSLRVDNKYLFKNIDFEIEQGKRYGFIGPSGVGKTTLMKIISGMMRDYEGMIFINDVEIKKISEQQTRDLFFFLQTQNFIFCVSPLENVTLFGDGKHPDTERCFEKVNLHKFLGSQIDSTQLSEGEQKRLGIARALFSNKEVLIFDEPWNNLDYANRKLIERYLLNTKKTIIIVSHHIDKEDTFFDYLFSFEKDGLKIVKNNNR